MRRVVRGSVEDDLLHSESHGIQGLQTLEFSHQRQETLDSSASTAGAGTGTAGAGTGTGAATAASAAHAASSCGRRLGWGIGHIGDPAGEVVDVTDNLL